MVEYQADWWSSLGTTRSSRGQEEHECGQETGTRLEVVGRKLLLLLLLLQDNRFDLEEVCIWVLVVGVHCIQAERVDCILVLEAEREDCTWVWRVHYIQEQWVNCIQV